MIAVDCSRVSQSAMHTKHLTHNTLRHMKSIKIAVLQMKKEKVIQSYV